MLIKEITKGFLCASALAFLASISTLKAAVLAGVDPVSFTVGSGSDVSYLLIDESTLSSAPLLYEYRYTFDSNNLLTGFDLIQAVAAYPKTGLSIGTSSTSWGNQLQAITYQGHTITAANGFGIASGSYWSYYGAGGLENDGYSTVPDPTQWSYADVGSENRFISPDSIDGWTLASYVNGGLSPSDSIDVSPSVSIAAIPETGSRALFVSGLLFLFVFFRGWKLRVRI